MTKQRLPFRRKLLLALLLIVVGAAVYVPFSPIVVQRRDFARVGEFSARIRVRVADDPVLRRMKTSMSTFPQLYIMFDEDMSDSDWTRLLTIVREERDQYAHLPPVFVQIGPLGEARKLERFASK